MEDRDLSSRVERREEGDTERIRASLCVSMTELRERREREREKERERERAQTADNATSSRRELHDSLALDPAQCDLERNNKS